jgi:hypothetical protein
VEPDRLQRDSLAACVIAQQRSSLTFVSLHFHCRKEQFGSHFKNVINFAFFFTFLELRDSGIT